MLLGIETLELCSWWYLIFFILKILPLNSFHSVQVSIRMTLLTLILLTSVLSFCSSLDINPKPCMRGKHNNAHATFLKRHLPDGVPNTWDQNVWNTLLRQIKTCGRPTQSFFYESDRERVNAVCTKAGGKQHSDNLCISKEKFSFVTVRVNVKEGLCGIRSIRNESKHIILGCDEIQDTCRPVHFEGNPEEITPSNNQPDCGDRSGSNSGFKAVVSKSLLIFTLVVLMYNLWFGKLCWQMHWQHISVKCTVSDQLKVMQI